MGSKQRERSRKVDVRLPGNGDSNSHSARPVHLINTMTVESDLQVVNSELSLSSVHRVCPGRAPLALLPLGFRVQGLGFGV